jgi:hypothetical protein
MLSEGRPTKEEGRSRNIHEMVQATKPRQGILSSLAENILSSILNIVALESQS